MANLVSSIQAQTTPFGGPNLDGPDDIDGPQAGLSTDPPIVPLEGLGVIADSVIITVALDRPLQDLDFLTTNGILVEFGTDAAFLVPEPTSLLVLCVGGGLMVCRRRR